MFQLENSLPEHVPIDSKNRLGFYAEDLVKIGIDFSDNLELIAHNLQLRQNNQTLGEVDFILKDLQHNEFIHLEMAVKFYLLKINGNTLHDFIGPSGKDIFEKKAHRLQSHQLKLLERKEAIPLLKQLGIETITPQLFIPGMLFHHFKAHPLQLPELNKNLQWGKWCTISEFFAYFSEQDEWILRPKMDWLSLPETSPVTSAELKEKLYAQTLKLPILLTPSKTTSQRIFIVDNHWPIEE